MLKALLTLCLLFATLTAFAVDNKTALNKVTLTKDEKVMTHASPPLKQRLHIILLGVNDVAKSVCSIKLHF